MTLEEVLEHYVTWANCMRRIGLSRHAYQNWQRRGYIPFVSQERIEKETKGRLKICEAEKENHVTRKAEAAKRARAFLQSRNLD